MTDEVGIVQHAVIDVPNRSCGYCTDDAGRALIVACEAASRSGTEAEGARLIRTYLAYLLDAQQPDGWFHNFMGYDRRWQDRYGTADAVGRAIWGLGCAELRAPRESWRAVARLMRSRAYAALGLVQALEARPDDELAVRAALDESLAMIADALDATRSEDESWVWCEDALTYDNARLCEALIRGGVALGEERYRAAGLAMLRFYCTVVLEDDPATGSSAEPVFVPVGNDGWFPRGGVKAREGQQPLEAAALVDAALAAYDATGDPFWPAVAEIAHAWYFGRNSRGLPVATEHGCRDGIDRSGVNANMGAESTICYLMSAMAMAKRSAARPLRVARAARASSGTRAP
jgi:hypothetical protein